MLGGVGGCADLHASRLEVIHKEAGPQAAFSGLAGCFVAALGWVGGVYLVHGRLGKLGSALWAAQALAHQHKGLEVLQLLSLQRSGSSMFVGHSAGTKASWPRSCLL